MKNLSCVALMVLLACATGSARAAPIKIVAAENFYGSVAQQIGGSSVEVVSVLSNPDQDPQIVIYNGADYDPWMPKLLAATPKPRRAVIVAAELMHKQAGDNPHLWYDPPTMPAVARALAAALETADPHHASDYRQRLASFLTSLEPIEEKIEMLRKKYAGIAVTASEPVFGYMAAALGLRMHNESFELSVMNNTEPSARDVAGFETDLKTHRVRVMFYNKQACDKIVQQLVEIARASKIPVVGVTETVPSGMTFQQWIQSELADTEKALAGPNS